MKYIPPEIVNEVKKIDLFTYLKTYEPHELIHISGGEYKTKTHGSLKISNGMWNWFKGGIGGKSAVDYLIKMEGYSFVEAIGHILEKMEISKVVPYENKLTKEDKKLVLPLPNKTNSKVISYLCSRGIDREIVMECIDKNMIYEDINHNVVFVGYDEKNIAKYAMCRATNCSRFMHDISGSTKQYSFQLNSIESSKSVHLFESAIDLLSYATLLKLTGQNYRNYNLISLSGVYQPAKIIEQSKMPISLKRYLESNKEITKIYLHLDNDIAGRNATKALKFVLEKDYEVIDNPPPKGKDINDYLCDLLGKNVIKSKENSSFSRY